MRNFLLSTALQSYVKHLECYAIQLKVTESNFPEDHGKMKLGFFFFICLFYSILR